LRRVVGERAEGEAVRHHEQVRLGALQQESIPAAEAAERVDAALAARRRFGRVMRCDPRPVLRKRLARELAELDVRELRQDALRHVPSLERDRRRLARAKSGAREAHVERPLRKCARLLAAAWGEPCVAAD